MFAKVLNEKDIQNDNNKMTANQSLGSEHDVYDDV